MSSRINRLLLFWLARPVVFVFDSVLPPCLDWTSRWCYAFFLLGCELARLAVWAYLHLCGCVVGVCMTISALLLIYTVVYGVIYVKPVMVCLSTRLRGRDTTKRRVQL